MSCAIVCASLTGNTRQLAEVARDYTGASCLCLTEPGSVPEAARSADLLLVGSWCWKGTCTPEVTHLLASLRDRDVFLFGTYGASLPGYGERMVSRMAENLHESCRLVGSYTCQGRMTQTSLEKKQARLDAAEPGTDAYERALRSVENWHRALSHPDDLDLRGMAQALEAIGL